MEAVKAGNSELPFEVALEKVRALIRREHKPAVWDYDVAKKATQLRLSP
jgi:hypothetical protein